MQTNKFQQIEYDKEIEDLFFETIKQKNVEN